MAANSIMPLTVPRLRQPFLAVEVKDLFGSRPWASKEGSLPKNGRILRGQACQSKPSMNH